MSDLAWVLIGGTLMSAIALVGGVTTVVGAATLERALLPLVSLAAGSLLGGAFFHMIPEAAAAHPPLVTSAWIVGGFTAFLALEQLLHWHHCHRAAASCRQPVTYLILVGDALHNFLGGLGIAGTFLVDSRAGMMAWLAGAAHEIPQELGDFGILVHGGWGRRQALAWNVLSGLTFLAGALVAYVASAATDASLLALFGAGNFLYIGASDLVPEIRSHATIGRAALHFGCFAVSVILMFVLALVRF